MSELVNALSAVFGAENVIAIDSDEDEKLTGFELVPSRQRSKFYPSLVAGNMRSMMALEAYFYQTLSESCSQYGGGYFDFVVFSNGAKAPILNMADETKVSVIGRDNWYEGVMTFRTLSLVAFALVTNRIAHVETDPAARKALTDNWRLLMDVIYSHDFLDGERDEAIAFLD